MNLLERVKYLCSEKGISQRKLEIDLGLSNGASSKWSKSSPSGEVLDKIADYFGVTIDYLLGRTAFKNTQELFEHWGSKGKYFVPGVDFGGILQTEREKQNISQKEIAEKLEMTISDIDNIEEGVLTINSELAEKFAKALNTTVEELFKENEFWTTYEEPATIAAHLPEGVELTEEEQEQLDEYIQFILSKRNK